MNNAATQDAIETLEDYTEFFRWNQTRRPMAKSRVPMSFSAEKPKDTAAGTIRRVLDLLEQGVKEGELDLANFNRFRELGERALQRLEGGQAGSSEFVKSIVSGARLGMVSPVCASGMATAVQNMSGRVGGDYFSSWMNIGK